MTRAKVIKHKHEVKARIHMPVLAKAGSSLKLQLYADGEKIGEMHIGRGSLFWWGRHRHTRKRVDWSKFAQLMDGLAYTE
jgi:hypothetical protein